MCEQGIGMGRSRGRRKQVCVDGTHTGGCGDRAVVERRDEVEIRLEEGEDYGTRDLKNPACRTRHVLGFRGCIAGNMREKGNGADSSICAPQARAGFADRGRFLTALAFRTQAHCKMRSSSGPSSFIQYSSSGGGSAM